MRAIRKSPSPRRAATFTETTRSTLPWISPLTSGKPTPSPPPAPSPAGPSPARKKHITHSSLVSLISRCSPSSPQPAIDAFNCAALQPGFSHNHATVSALALLLARSHRSLSALDSLLLRLLPLLPSRLHESLFLSLMSHFSRLRLPLRALRSFHLIPLLSRRTPSARAFSTCLHLLLLRHSRPDLARSLLLHRYALPLSTCIYNILLKYHCHRTKDLDTSFRILRKMRASSDARPNLVTYTTLMAALCAAGKLRDAYQLFDEMVELDGLFPDPVTYNVLIVGFCRAGMPDKARRVLEFMGRNGCEPNLFNYSALMDGLCKAGKLEEARDIFDRIRGMRRETADVVSYTTLVGCLCRMGRTEEGISLVREMREKGCKLDVVIFNVVLGGLCEEGRFAEAVALLEEVPWEEVRPNVASHRIVINSLYKGGELRQAVQLLLRVMLGRAVLPHHATCNSLLLSLCDAGMLADATATLSGLLEGGFLPEAETWSRLLDGVCRERKLGTVTRMLDDLDASSTQQQCSS